MLSSSLRLLRNLDLNQETKRDRLRWFAGIIDGEGSFGIYKTSSKKDFYGKIQLQNTSLPMIRKIKWIARNDLGLNKFLFGTGRRYRNNGEDSSIFHYFSWQSKHDLDILLGFLPEMLVAKQEEAFLFRDWYEYRQDETLRNFETDQLFAERLQQMKEIPK